MIRISTRPITQQEIKLLSTHCHVFERNPLIVAVFAALIFMFLIVSLIGSLTHFFSELNEYNFIIYSLIVILLILSIFISYKICRPYKKPLLEEVLEDTVEIVDVEASDAIKVEEFEDEGVGYYLNIGDGRVFFVQGQYLYDEDENGEPEKKIPSTHMRITRSQLSQMFLDVEFLGQYLPPSHTNPPFTEDNRVPEDCEILEVDFESLKKI